MRHHLTLLAKAFFGFILPIDLFRRTVGVVYSIIFDPLVVQLANQ